MTPAEIAEKLLALLPVYKKEEEELATMENSLLGAEKVRATREANLTLSGLAGRNEGERKAYLYAQCEPSHEIILQLTEKRNLLRAYRDVTLREIRVLTAILASKGNADGGHGPDTA